MVILWWSYDEVMTTFWRFYYQLMIFCKFGPLILPDCKFFDLCWTYFSRCHSSEQFKHFLVEKIAVVHVGKSTSARSWEFAKLKQLSSDLLPLTTCYIWTYWHYWRQYVMRCIISLKWRYIGPYYFGKFIDSINQNNIGALQFWVTNSKLVQFTLVVIFSSLLKSLLEFLVIRHKGQWPWSSAYHWASEKWVLCSTKDRKMDQLCFSRQGWWLDGTSLFDFSILMVHRCCWNECI